MAEEDKDQRERDPLVWVRFHTERAGRVGQLCIFLTYELDFYGTKLVLWHGELYSKRAKDIKAFGTQNKLSYVYHENSIV